MVKNNKGFTLVEILLALSIIAFCSVPMYRLIKAQARLVQAGRDMETALNLAQEQAEHIRLSSKLPFEFNKSQKNFFIDNKQWIVKTSIPEFEAGVMDPLAPVQIDIRVYNVSDEKLVCEISVLK
ncbi:MAG: type II secretion system protein [Elusimicrobiota bacterium]